MPLVKDLLPVLFILLPAVRMGDYDYKEATREGKFLTCSRKEHYDDCWMSLLSLVICDTSIQDTDHHEKSEASLHDNIGHFDVQCSWIRSWSSIQQ